MKRLVVLVALLFACDVDRDDGNLDSTLVPQTLTATASLCGGFDTVRQEPTAVSPTDSAYLRAELLRWSMSGSPDTLAISHTRKILNCLARLETRVSWTGDTLVITEYDLRSDNLSAWEMAMCSCPFDTYVELTGIGREPLIVQILQYREPVGVGTDTARAVIDTATLTLNLSLDSGRETLNDVPFSESFP